MKDMQPTSHHETLTPPPVTVEDLVRGLHFGLTIEEILALYSPQRLPTDAKQREDMIEQALRQARY